MPMTPEIRAALEKCPNLPSPPKVALQLIELGRDPDISFTELSRPLARDPALASRILRAGNSALYAMRRRSANLRQAMVVVGLNATLTLALGFALSQSMASNPRSLAGISMVWRRSLISATASRMLAHRFGLEELEDLFLAALLQDIGVLALDAAMTKDYRPLLVSVQDHETLLASERDRLPTDHGEAGSWLLQHWNLPPRLCMIPAAVHDPENPAIPPDDRAFVQCIATAGHIADLFLLATDHQEASEATLARAGNLLKIDAEEVEPILQAVAEVMPEVSELYDTKLLTPDQAIAVIDQARDLLASRNLRLIQEMERQQKRTEEVQQSVERLTEMNTLDPLTKLPNRLRLDETLGAEFEVAKENGWPLSVAFIDLDDFKEINDTLGHLSGDAVLMHVARTLRGGLRHRDFVMRYGGDEFIAIFPGTALPRAEQVCERLRLEIQEHKLLLADGRSASATVSIGVATQMSGDSDFATPQDLLRAADSALYRSKKAGRNCVSVDTSHDSDLRTST